MSDELLPCPFCRGKAEPYPDGDMEGHSIMCTGRGALFGGDKACCPMTTFGFASHDDAVAAWNRRPTAPDTSSAPKSLNGTPQGNPCDRMFMAAVASLAEISVALGIPDEEAVCANGNELILERISELVDAARDFHNLTRGDPEVRILPPSAEKRDAIVAAGERLRAVVKEVPRGA